MTNERMTNEEAVRMLKAKLACLSMDVSGCYGECNEELCDECPLNYEQGNMGEQKEYIRMSIEALERESCNDAISRQAVLEKQYRIDDSITLSTRDVVNVEDIEDLSPVAPQPRTGHWIHHKEKEFVCAEHWECSQCHRTTMTYPFSVNGNDYDTMYYCPKCGAKMVEPQEVSKE